MLSCSSLSVDFLGMKNVIKNLQARPYEEKIRILKIAAIATGILILVIWGLTLKFRTREHADNSKFDGLIKNLKEFKSKFDGQGN